MFIRTATWIGVVAPVGCAAPFGPSTNVAYVLLDRDARAAGTLTVGGWRGAPRLPVSAEVGEVVVFAGSDGHVSGRTSPSDGARTIELRSQMLAYLRGAAGDVEWVDVGSAARSDSLLLESDDAAAEALARTVGGRVAAAAGDRR